MLHWLLAGVACLVIAAVVFLPALFLLASTPLHDGSDSPGPLLLLTAIAVSSITGLVAAWAIYSLLRNRRAKQGADVEA